MSSRVLFVEFGVLTLPCMRSSMQLLPETKFDKTYVEMKIDSSMLTVYPSPDAFSDLNASIFFLKPQVQLKISKLN